MHRVGIIPFDMKGEAVALLFVTSQTRGRWILPKGQPKPGETQAEACHREGFEEAGIRGIVLEEYPSTVLIGKKTGIGVEQVPVTYFPYLVQEQFDDWPEMEKRQRHWALVEDAPKVTDRADYLALVQHFQALRPWITEAAKVHKS
ncbi:MAG: NUDIX hydrolase [Hyphomicrobiaceae bacterium]